jgi:Abortive infection alpha
MKRLGDNNLIPISDEQAKLARALVEAARASGAYGTDILGDLPKDALGWLIGDRVKVKRAERMAILIENAKKRLEDQGIIEPEPPSLKLALPILAAAADENREELLNLWEGLLAAAMNPKRQDLVRQSLISTVKEMDAFDALVFNLIAEHGGGQWTNGRDEMASKLQVPMDDVLVSLHNLGRLSLISYVGSPPYIDPFLAPLGNLLIRAIA